MNGVVVIVGVQCGVCGRLVCVPVRVRGDCLCDCMCGCVVGRARARACARLSVYVLCAYAVWLCVSA